MKMKHLIGFSLLLVSSIVSAQFTPTAQYYLFDHIDMRKCMSPICGGDFIRQANTARTRCVDGTLQPFCYASRLDFGQMDLDEATQSDFIARFHTGKALVRGTFGTETFNAINIPVLHVTEAWDTVSGTASIGSYFRVHENDIVCITTPCPHLTDERLNLIGEHPLAGLRLDTTQADPSQIAEANRLLQTTGVVVRGQIYGITGPAGKGRLLVAKALFLPVKAPSIDGQTCGGIRGLVCAEGQVCLIETPHVCQSAEMTGICTVQHRSVH